MLINYDEMSVEKFRYLTLLAYFSCKPTNRTSIVRERAKEFYLVGSKPDLTPAWVSNIVLLGFSVSCRYDKEGVPQYWHVQRGPEEPENHTLHAHENLNRALCTSLVKCFWLLEEDLPELPDWVG